MGCKATHKMLVKLTTGLWMTQKVVPWQYKGWNLCSLRSQRVNLLESKCSFVNRKYIGWKPLLIWSQTTTALENEYSFLTIHWFETPVFVNCGHDSPLFCYLTSSKQTIANYFYDMASLMLTSHLNEIFVHDPNINSVWSHLNEDTHHRHNLYSKIYIE